MDFSHCSVSLLQVERVITLLSDPVSLILREFLASLTKYDTQQGISACTNVADSLASKCTVLEGQKQTPDLQAHNGFGSRRNVFGSLDQLLTSPVPDLPLRMGKVRWNMNLGPVELKMLLCEVYCIQLCKCYGRNMS
jgi:hypothetical protein